VGVYFPVACYVLGYLGFLRRSQKLDPCDLVRLVDFLGVVEVSGGLLFGGFINHAPNIFGFLVFGAVEIEVKIVVRLLGLFMTGVAGVIFEGQLLKDDLKHALSGLAAPGGYLHAIIIILCRLQSEFNSPFCS
jgi:hypothetical protein